MAGRKLTKYERMWRTRRHNAKLKAMALEVKPEVVRTSTKRLKPGTELVVDWTVVEKAFKKNMRPLPDTHAAPRVSAPETFIVVTDSMGRGVMVKIDDVLRAAEAIKQTGYVE